MFGLFDKSAALKAMNFLEAACKSGELNRISQTATEASAILRDAGLNNEEINFVLAMLIPSDEATYQTVFGAEGKITVDLSKLRRSFKKIFVLPKSNQFLYDLSRPIVFEP